jgi:hypothetical protein
MKAKLLRLLNRLKEPSTYAGLGGAAMLFGMNMPEFQTWANAIAGVALTISIIIKETGSAE